MVFCCIAICALAVLYFTLLWLRQVFSWPRRDWTASMLPSPRRILTQHGAWPVYGHTNLFTSRAGDTALLFVTTDQHTNHNHNNNNNGSKKNSCRPLKPGSSKSNANDCFCLFIWGEWRVAVIGPHRAKTVLTSTELKESWPWTPPINLLGKSCFAFVNNDMEREHLRMLLARPLCHAQVVLYAPIFAQLAEQCLAQIQEGKFGKKKNKNSNNNNNASSHSSRSNTSQRCEQHHQQEQQQPDDDHNSRHGDGGAASTADDLEHDECDTFVNGPQGQVLYYKVKWEALRSYTLDLMDGPILNTQRWNNNDETKDIFSVVPSSSQPLPLHDPAVTKTKTSSDDENKNDKSKNFQTTSNKSQSPPATTTSTTAPPPPSVPSRETMLLYMERMKRGIDVIKTTFGPEWMYIWLCNEYGRALNARQHIDKIMRKHVAVLAEAEQKVRHAVGHAYTDPTTQPIPLLTLRENLLRNKEGIMGIDYSSSTNNNTNSFAAGYGAAAAAAGYYTYYHGHHKRIIKPQFSAPRPRARSAPDYASAMALEESSAAPSSTLFNHSATTAVPTRHAQQQQLGHVGVAPHEEEEEEDGLLFSQEANDDDDNNHNNGIVVPPSLRLVHSSDDAVAYAKFQQQQQQMQREKDQKKANRITKSVRLLDVMEEKLKAPPLFSDNNNNECNNSNNNENNNQHHNCNNNSKATAKMHPTATSASSSTAVAAAAAAATDYVEPYTTEQDLARPRYETSPIRLRRKMVQQLAELESCESITARQFHDELERPRISRHQQQHLPHVPVLRNGHNGNKSTNNSQNHSSNSATPSRPPRPPLPIAPPRPVMSVLERFMKQHDNAGNGLSQIVMAEISVLLWMMMDVGNAWTAMALHLLSADREACHLVQDELDSLVLDFASGSVDHGDGQAPAATPLHQSLLFTPSVMSRMKYLDALLYEAIRLCPENLGGMKKTTQTVELPDAGVQIPKDTNIFFCQPTDMVFDIHKALGKKPENLGRQYPSVELYGFLPLHGLEVPLMVLQSKVFLITLLQKFSPFISPKRTFLRRITTKLNQSIQNIKHKTQHQHRRTASGDGCNVDPSAAASTRRNKSTSSDEEEQADGHDQVTNDRRDNNNSDDAIIMDDPHLFMDVSLYSNSKECRSCDQGIEGMLEMQRPTSGSTAESTKPPDGGTTANSAGGGGDAYDQQQPPSGQSSLSGDDDDLEEGNGGGEQRSQLHHHDPDEKRVITPADAAELFNKIPFPEPRRVILLRPRSLD